MPKVPKILPTNPTLPTSPLAFYESARWRLLSLTTWSVAVLFIGLVLGLYGVLDVPGFLESLKERNYLLNNMLPLFFIVGPMVMIIAAGALDLSVGAMAALVSVVVATMMSRDYALLPSFGVGMTVALVAGLTNALLIGVVRVNGVLATLGMAVVLRGLAQRLSGGTAISIEGASSLLFELPDSRTTWGLLGIYVLACIILVQVTPFGCRPGPIRELRETRLRRAAFIGPPYLLASLMAGMAGICLAAMHKEGAPMLDSPDGFLGLEFRVILAVVLGGTVVGGRFGSITGALLGVVVISLLDFILELKGMDSFDRGLVAGAVLLTSALVCRVYFDVIATFYEDFRKKQG